MDELTRELEKLNKDNIYPFHMPGHKRQPEWIANPYKYDITEISNFDDLHNSKGILRNLQNRFNELYGCSESFLLVNGSTCGVLSAVSAVVNCGETILIARNCHKSVYNAVFLKRCRVEYIYPQIYGGTGISDGVCVQDVESSLKENRDIKAVVITSPTYEGVMSDVNAIADIVHKYGAILVVDAAHGAHIGIENGHTLGGSKADIIILSLHKTLPALTQTALLCVNNLNLLEQVNRYINIYETTSPSYLFMAGAEKCLNYISDKNVIKDYNEKILKYREELKKLRKLKLFETRKYDFSKIVIDTTESNITGTELKNLLLEKYDIELEMATVNYALAMTSCMDTIEGFQRLRDALFEIDSRLINKNDIGNDGIKKTKKYFEAWECENYSMEIVELENSKGYICSEYIYVYPPGIPILVPGELVTDEIIDDLQGMIENNMVIRGLINNKKIKVIKGYYYG